MPQGRCCSSCSRPSAQRIGDASTRTGKQVHQAGGTCQSRRLGGLLIEVSAEVGVVHGQLRAQGPSMLKARRSSQLRVGPSTFQCS
eukprot:5136232-Amphidinium_carterae.2